MFLLISSLIAHLVLANMVPWPWLVPDLSLVGLVLAVIRAPQRWWLYSVLLGEIMMVWTTRFPLPTLLSYLAIGGAVRLLMRRWNLQELRMRLLVTSGAVVLMQCASLWMAAVWSMSLVGWVLARTALTAITVVCIRPLSS